MQTNIQRWIKQERAAYSTLRKPLLAQLAQLHGISVRDFAAIFKVSKSNAQEILAHRKDPPLGLAFQVARYFEVTVDELFGWKYDDAGDRRPLVIEVGRKLVRLSHKIEGHRALALV